MTRLAGRTAIVTGGSRGIGEAIAAAFAREGARVVVASRKPEGVAAAAARINAEVPGAAVGIPCHLGQVETLGPFVERVAREVGRADILVNNAATNPYYGPSLDLEWAAWDKTFEVNLKGPFELTRHFCRGLLDAGRGGAVVNISSIFGLRGAPGQVIYAMTKAALISLTRTLALELAPGGIRVNAIAPGLIETRFASAMLADPAVLDGYNGRAALRRPGRPEEVAGLAVHLASDESSYTTGQVFGVDGGFAAG